MIEDKTGYLLSLEALERHCAVLGGSGSGKTVACKSIVEDGLRQGASLVTVDTQGDIVPLLCTKSLGIKVKKRLLWLGKNCGLNPLPSMTCGNVRYVSRVLAAMASLQREPANALYSVLAASLPEGRQPLDIGGVADLLADVNLEHWSQYASKRTLDTTRRAFAGLALNPIYGLPAPAAADIWGVGQSVTVVYCADATREDQCALIAQVAGLVGEEMTKRTSGRKLMVYLDEVAGLVHPTKNSETKSTISLLARQGRKYGICLVLATQSPSDVCHTVLAQMGTTYLGRLSSHRDLAKVGKICDNRQIVNGLPRRKVGNFAKLDRDGVIDITVPFCKTPHVVVGVDRIRRALQTS